MATNLSPVDSREVVRCDSCLLVQFRTSDNFCRRCHSSFEEREGYDAAEPVKGSGHFNLANSIRSLRLRRGLSQRELAIRMSVSRTYVSKIENEKNTPSLASLERLAKALEVNVPTLLSDGERNRQEEIRDLMRHQFVADLLPYAPQLNGGQMSSILTLMRGMTLRKRLMGSDEMEGVGA